MNLNSIKYNVTLGGEPAGLLGLKPVSVLQVRPLSMMSNTNVKGSKQLPRNDAVLDLLPLTERKCDGDDDAGRRNGHNLLRWRMGCHHHCCGDTDYVSRKRDLQCGDHDASPPRSASGDIRRRWLCVVFYRSDLCVDCNVYDDGRLRDRMQEFLLLTSPCFNSAEGAGVCATPSCPAGQYLMFDDALNMHVCSPCGGVSRAFPIFLCL